MHKLFRFINIAFTAAAMAIAIRIRNMEERNGVMGAVGSSPCVSIVGTRVEVSSLTRSGL